MKRSWNLGEYAGIDVFVHWSFLLLPTWIVLAGLVGGASIVNVVNSVILVFVVFGCIVLHEFGHALTARRFGIGTRDITLYPFGGVASLDRMPELPKQELAVALAGPAVNVVLAIFCFLALMLNRSGSFGLRIPANDQFLLVQLMWINMGIAVFNMLPAFPMDGGRVFRALLAKRLSYVHATNIAASVGQVLAVVLALVGLLTSWKLTLVALFVFMAGRAEAAMVRRQAAGVRRLTSDSTRIGFEGLA